MEYAKSLIKQRETNAQTETDTEDGEEVEVEESWTLVENDSDPEAMSPTAMMQPQAQGRSPGGKGKLGLRYLPLSK